MTGSSVLLRFPSQTNKSRLMKYCLPAFLLFPCFLGCSDSRTVENTQPATSSQSSAVPVSADNADAITALEALGAKLQRDSRGHITEVNLRDTAATNDDLIRVAALQHVSSVLLNDLPVSDDGIAILATSESPFANLDLRGCPIGNDSMALIKNMLSLKALRLNGVSGSTTVDDGGIVHLAGLTNLKVLVLDGLWVSEVGLEPLDKLVNLEELYMKSTTISDEGLLLLTRYPKLKKLRLAFNQISNDGLAHLAFIKTLEELDLSENSLLSDDGLAHLSGLTNLKKLNLWRLAITDSGISHLTGLTNLQWLNLDNTQLSDGGLPALLQMKKLTFLHLGSTTVSDAGLLLLQQLTALKDLKVTRTAVTEAGVAALQPLLPNTAIQQLYIEGE